ncbi:uncharacterized protein L203_100724 [Cryptococcus depauperatus CBS 7841]|uniref:Cytoplasmic protein n=1 Tax=Cryptococcus depauperatus CBS 7841 TaxID=1295531 RepID=A0AAJ8LZE4_9TREE
MGIFQFTRHLATQKTSSAPLTLQSLSPFIRSRHPPSSVALVRPDDFIFYPNYLSEEEQEVLIGLGLWKLERSGTVSERRSRRRKKTEEEGEKHREAQSGLQRLFSGNYGFEQGHYDSEDGDDGWDVRLSSGSVYIQRDCVRYNYEHAILPYGHEGSIWDGKRLEKGHRLSIMVRDAPTRSEGL